MYGILLVIHVILAIMLVTLILLQHGKGAQTGASFGMGASQTVFGSQGSGGFLSRATGIIAALFFILNLFLAYWVTKSSRVPVAHKVQQESQESSVPATDVPQID